MTLEFRDLYVPQIKIPGDFQDLPEILFAYHPNEEEFLDGYVPLPLLRRGFVDIAWDRSGNICDLDPY